MLLSDSNSVFLSHVLAGAKASGLVDEMVCNSAAFEKVWGWGCHLLCSVI